jgi:CRISPR-associated endonuclease/helicase Cas3
MARIDEQTKLQRKERVHLIVAGANGLRESEIAALAGLEQRTANNYLHELEYEGQIFKDGLLWFGLNVHGTKLRSFELSPEEAYTLYLAARLLVKQHDKRNEPAETALLKLAKVLSSDLGVGSEIAQAAAELAQRPMKAGYQSVFRTVVQGYLYRRQLDLVYRPYGGKPFSTVFSPYLLEPSAIGFTTYAIGHSSRVGALRSYRLDRIESAQLKRDPYQIPADFPGLDILRNAWSIIIGETTTRVVLRFSPAVKERVLETRWHPSQDSMDDPDKPGYLRWWVDVADTTDMKPWIRSWGADVEVLEPKPLRKALESEVQKLAKSYGVSVVKAEDELIAHRRERDGMEQPLIDHLTQTSQLAERFAAKVGLPEVGKIMGLLHDLGKASGEFQGYLRSRQGLISPDEDGYVDAKRGEVDHSTAGAQLVYEKLASRGRDGKILAQFLALAIASHHSGLIDCLKLTGENNFERRITKDDKDTRLTEARSRLPIIEQRLDETLIEQIEGQFFKKIFVEIKEPTDSQSTLPFKHGLLARFLLSCLLDADRLNTADFENPGNEAIRNYGKYLPWEALIERLETKFTEFALSTVGMQAGSRAWEVNQLRAQVGQACLNMALKPRGIYRLTVPTGGGKTLASLRFGLHHAQKHQLERVFYIVPYLTIIDQNADKVREILEPTNERDRVVLEHHSNLTPEQETRRHNLLAENWDAPIVFTTQVQFLEALFGSGTRDARRMHQFANSVIILDEVQTIPIKTTHMFLTALRFLTHDCGATVVLCTATQPPFDKLDNPYRELKIPPEQHIIQNEAELFERLRRVEVHDDRKPGGLTNAEIADLAAHALQEKGSVLIVVNTRTSALALYQQIKAQDLDATVYHLSTNMCPAHRVDVLNKIKGKLNADEPVICVSTQLIEAGVDIDFGAVIRALAGLDSIAQSAGRCNRHGVRDGLGSVWVVNPQEESLDRLVDIKIGRGHAQRVLDDFRDNPEPFGNDRIGLNAIAAYYDYYYRSRENEMRYPVSPVSAVGRNDDLFNLLSLNTLSTKAQEGTYRSAPGILLRQSFQSAAREFHVIDSITRGVVVPYREGNEIITDLCGAFALERQGKLLKRAQRYSVSLFGYQFDRLVKAGAIQEVQTGAGVYYLDKQYYSEEFGWGDEPANSMDIHIV